MFEAKVFVSIKDGVLDPQGKAVTNALHSLGYKNADNARVGKYITLHINATDKTKAEAELKEMCDRLLTNPLIEKYSYELIKK
ncbi:MAG: phosphoribosylformylglycinamidine synthase subunit PurS [Candidatus Margulisbacteria bacterium]|nr:phosphoribosylformylglycinamidine synthase subunit PurS [Candidatus Margulisiibacteriota bacterium]